MAVNPLRAMLNKSCLVHTLLANGRGGSGVTNPGFVHPGADGSRRTPSLSTCRGQRRQDDLADVALLQLDQIIEMGSHPRGGDP